MNDDSNKILFDQHISLLWNEIMGLCPNVGAFVMNHENKTAYADDNCLKLFASSDSDLYEDLSKALIELDKASGSSMILKKLIDTPAVTFAVLKLKNNSNEAESISSELLERFRRLIDNNLFMYHFQPIVDAHTGKVFAHEALMRTDSTISLFPDEILDIAQKTGELYSIEKATIRNTMKYVYENKELFSDTKLFINSITACLLKEKEWLPIEKEYSSIMPKIVVEMTEQTEIHPDHINIIKARMEKNGFEMAVDDYGTGYSNTSNLLRYMPKYVKIDRSLISEIDTKKNAQKVVASLIEIMHNNGILVLAEGVETLDEIRTVIMLGVDLLQGYYISKPKPFVMKEIAETTQKEIISINLEYTSEIAKIYHTSEDEIIDLHKLVNKRYTTIYVESSNVTVYGNPTELTNINIIIKDGFDAHLTLIDAGFRADRSTDIISIGTNSKLLLELKGQNVMIGKGIYVPETALLEIIGSGNLRIFAERTKCYGIGTAKDTSHGTIIIGLTGLLDIETNGDDVVSIGGGRNVRGNQICIKSGKINIHASGNNCLGIGVLYGDSVIDISNCEISVDISSSNCIAIGVFEGKNSVKIKDYKISVSLQGIRLCGIGTGTEGSSFSIITDGNYRAVYKGREIIGIGSCKGDANIDIRNTDFDILCEGNFATAIGSLSNTSMINLQRCYNKIIVTSQNAKVFGAPEENITILNCNDQINVSS